MEKLKDYIDGLTQLRSDKFVFGSIRTTKKDFSHAKNVLEAQGISILNIDNDHPDVLIEILARRFEKKQATAITITDNIPVKLLNQLHNFNQGNLNVHLAGHSTPTVINPLPEGAMLILIFVDSEPDMFGVQPALSSIARI